MLNISSQLLYPIEILIFVSVIFMHLVKKNTSIVIFYLVQSFLIALLLFILSFREASVFLLFVITLTFVVKVIIAPYFFFRLIKKHQLKFSASTYVNTPIILIVITALTALARSSLLKPIITLSAAGENILLLSIATIFISFFLIINRKGALSQMIGILSFENGIVSFAVFAGMEQTPGLQLGIIFDILIWIIIATVFISMIFRHYGSLDVTSMSNLKE